MKKILVLGATSGVAQAFCREALSRGWSLILAGRNGERLKILARDLEIRSGSETISCLDFDATRFETHSAFLKEALAFGPIAGCFVACGVMHEQAQAETEWALSEEMMACNYTGIVSVLNPLARHFAAEGQGFISCLTSVAGDRGRRSNFIYGSTKAALNTYLEGLRAQLHASGVLVQTIKLGPVDTPMNSGVARPPFMISADAAAHSILNALERRAEVVYVPARWSIIMLVIRLLPRWIFKRVKF